MRYFIGFLVTVGLIIILILLLFGGGDKAKLPKSTKTLDSYASSNAEARLTIDGPVNADVIHQQIQINVAQNEVTYKQIRGYEGTVTKTTRYENNRSAYATFLRALALAGFTKGSLDAQLKDERGYCPLGSRYIFEFIQGDKKIERFWATSCGNPKTYLGSFRLTTQLFEAQVPNFTDVNRDTGLL